MKRIFPTLMLTALLAIFSVNATAQNSFNYQAVIRDGGKILVNKTVNLRLSVMLDGIIYYSEQHTATTNAYGNVSVSVGEGTPLTGSFAAIPWESMRVMMQVEASTDGTDNYTNMGSMQIQPVPYTMYAARISVIQPAEASDEPIFQVKDNTGNLLFAVYETGVKVYVDDNDNTKAAKSKFAVAGRRAGKSDEDLLTINADGTMVYVDDNSKAAKSKFAVAGRRAKGSNYLMAIDGSGSTIYVDDNQSGKAAKSKFAVAGRRTNKAEENNYSIDGDGSTVYVDFDDNASKGNADVLTIDGGQATFYIDDTEEGKAAKSKFAVAGRRAKDVQTAFVIDGSGTLIYVDELDDSKAAKSKFAVAGRPASKNNNNFFTISQDSIRIYINDQPETTDSTGTMVTPSLSTGFAIVGMTQKNDLFVVNKDSTMIKTDTYVEEVQSISGEVEKIVDDSKAQRYYSTGNVSLRVEKKEGYETIAEAEAFITYTYYQDENGEYLYLDNQWDEIYHEYRNYWLVDGLIYHDITYVYSAATGLDPINGNDLDIYLIEPETYEPIKCEDKDLLTILESKMKADGYKALNFDGVNHYYKVEDEDDWEVMQAKRNVVTSLNDADIFSNNFATFKTLLNSMYRISVFNCDLNEDEITDVMWTDSDYGYTLLDDEISGENIRKIEKEQQSIDTLPDTESEIYSAQNPNLQCRHTLDEIQSMLYSLKYGFTVNTSSTYGGSVNVSVVEGGTTDYGYYKYGTVLELTAIVTDEEYVFAGWSDGNKDEVRRVSVPDEANYEAVFKIQPFRYSTQTINGVNTAIIHGYTNDYIVYEDDLVIPEKITVGGVEYIVTVISTEAFVGKGLKTVILPPTIKTIGRDAFEGNRELWYVNIPDGVTSIGSGAFLGCGLRGVYIPESVTEIGMNAFSYCDIYCQRETKPEGWADDWAGSDCRVNWNQTVLPDYGYTITDYENHTVEFGPYYSPKSEVTIPATISIDGTDYTVTSIAPRLFKENHMVEKVVIEAGISEIPYEVFRFANNLKEISLPATVGSFGEQTFYGCKSLQTITLANGNPYWKIEGDALYSIDGKQLLVYFARTTKTDFEVPDSVEEISWYAFSYAQITNVSFPETLIKIGINAFSDCYNLTDTLTIPDNVTTIEWSAFSGCQYSGIHLPANLEALEAGVISEYITSVSIPANVKRIGNSAFWNCSQLAEINLPNSVTYIDDYAFGGTQLSKLVIPNSVTYIGKEILCGYSTENLPNLTFDTSSQWFYVIDGENTNTPIESSVYMTNGQIDVAKFLEFNNSYGMWK
ncbi:MAG: leucine-rich repeat domain-containing protein [Salinivirgaceae bacterium]|nr:leucine-rich repeat domain-containing protein [Salinivirgaceae bacterium]